MASMNISLPDPLHKFVEKEVRRGGYSTGSEYLLDLVQRARSEQDLVERLQAALASRDLGEFGPAGFNRLRQLARGVAPDRK